MNNLYLNGDPILPEIKLKEISDLVLGSEQPSMDFELSLSLVGDTEMRRYNKLYRGLDEPTDVLSFVTAQVPAGKELGNLSPDNVATGNTLLCDIVIDIKQLDRQKGYNNLVSEFITVYVHGLLHLAGYDHIRKTDAILMKEKEEYYIKRLQGDI
jgi:probable rRNA maturation factor